MTGLGRSWQKDWWWVALFCAVSGVFYFHAIKDKQNQVRELTFRLQEMEKDKILALTERENFRLQIDSQSDPSWIEMVLMRDLGVVPEGWLKVHFKR